MTATERLARYLAYREGYRWCAHNPGVVERRKQGHLLEEATRLLVNIDEWKLDAQTSAPLLTGGK